MEIVGMPMNFISAPLCCCTILMALWSCSRIFPIALLSSFSRSFRNFSTFSVMSQVPPQKYIMIFLCLRMPFLILSLMMSTRVLQSALLWHHSSKSNGEFGLGYSFRKQYPLLSDTRIALLICLPSGLSGCSSR